jgi:hypothetical protein
VEVRIVEGDQLDAAGQVVEALLGPAADLRGEPGLRPAGARLDQGAQRRGGGHQGQAGQRGDHPVGGGPLAEQGVEHARGGQQAEGGEGPTQQVEDDRRQGVARAGLPGHAHRLTDE